MPTCHLTAPAQVISAGYASCTGLSLFLVSAMRSVGIPSRVTGQGAGWVGSTHTLHFPSITALHCVATSAENRVVMGWASAAWVPLYCAVGMFSVGGTPLGAVYEALRSGP
jgi:transglutaminase-like putative cysteine protease